jgi:hypothetical protein
MARRTVENIAPTNATISWLTPAGVPTGLDENRRPVFPIEAHKIRCWLEQQKEGDDETFDSTDLSDPADIIFVGRIYTDFDLSLILKQSVSVKLDAIEKLPGFPSHELEFKARILWRGPVAILPPSIRFKQNIGQPITLAAKIRNKKAASISELQSSRVVD